jgi:dipeptidase E
VKLFLSSSDPQGAPGELRTLVGENRTCALVVNANDARPREFRDALLARVRADLVRVGFEPFELDLRDHFGDRDGDGVAGRIESAGLVWAHGGNAFVLRSAMSRSGFDRSIRRLLTTRDLTYGGNSAGAIVAGSTLRGVELVDPLDDLDAVGGEPVWDGMGLVTFAIAPHYRSAEPIGADIEGLVARLSRERIPHRTLRDGESIAIDGTNAVLIDHSREAEKFLAERRNSLTENIIGNRLTLQHPSPSSEAEQR